jgi:thiamine biosynthesis lipoprotein
MGTTVVLTAVNRAEDAVDTATNLAVEFANEWENRFSRFRPESELSRLNRAGSVGMVVSPTFLDLLLIAIDAFERTGGLFDPSILPALAGLGYDRDFAEAKRSKVSLAGAAPEPAGLMGAIRIDRRSRRVTMPPGCQLDFGGIAKGIFVDRLAERFAAWPGGCVSAGGDLRVWGQPPDGEHWVVGVEDPSDEDAELCLVSITAPEAAAVATSAMNRRLWWSGAARLHHLIDPATGRPVLGQLASATALAPNLATAEVATKAILVSGGRGETLQLANASGAVVVDLTGKLALIHGRQRHAYSVHPIDSPAISA